MASSSTPSQIKTLKVFVIAGEASGDILGGHVMKALSSLYPCEFHGVGGENMQEAGLKQSLFDISELSIMGFFEIIPHLPKVIKRLYQTKKYIINIKPDLIITIDAPGFNFALVKRLQGLNIPLIHVVAPTVWAWKPGRAKKIAKLYNHLFCLFPFEPPYFEKEELATTFIGHPVTTIPEPDLNQKEKSTALMLPGSRIGEIDRHFKIFADTINQTNYQKVLIPTLSHLKGKIEDLSLKYIKKPFEIITENKEHAFARANIALAASGTVSLELARYQVPAVIAYKLSPLTYFIAKRLVKTKFASLVNIIAGKAITPECIQQACNQNTLLEALTDVEQARENILKQYTNILKQIKFRPWSIGPNILKLCDLTPLRFFGRRAGKSVKGINLDIKKNIEEKFRLKSAFNWQSNKKTYLEIGFGGGEHLVEMAKRNPDLQFVGAEVFAPGVQSLCKHIHKNNLENIFFHDADVRFLLSKVPPHSLDGVFILFPDPWPKKRHNNRRIVQESTLRQLQGLIKPNGFIKIASDHFDYQIWIDEEIKKVSDILTQVRPNIKDRPSTEVWPQTRYEKKAEKNGDVSHFFELRNY